MPKQVTQLGFAIESAAAPHVVAIGIIVVIVIFVVIATVDGDF